MNLPDPSHTDAWMDVRLEAYLDGDLPIEERKAFEHLLDASEAWQKELRRARRIRSGLRRLSAPPCPDRVTAVVFERTGVRVRQQRSPKPLSTAFSWRALWRPVLAAGLLLLAVALAPLVSPPPAPGPSSYTQAEVEQATEEVKWTLAYLARVSERTGQTVQQDVFEERLVRPLQAALRSGTSFDDPEPSIQ